MDCKKAIEIAADVMRGWQTVEERRDLLSAEVIEARQVLKRILEQQGCEHFDPGVQDGALTTLMDIVIFG